MKELSSIIPNERGYFLPFVLFISLIIVSSVVTSIKIYQNDIKISKQNYEQLTAETIVQMSKQTFLQEKLYEGSERGQFTYTFPSGTADVQFEKLVNHSYFLQMNIITINDLSFQVELLVHIN